MPTQQIDSDGKSYSFTPGKNGSLTVNNPPSGVKPLYTPHASVAKSIGPCKTCGASMPESAESCPTCGASNAATYSDALSKASRISPTGIGSVRG